MLVNFIVAIILAPFVGACLSALLCLSSFCCRVATVKENNTTTAGDLLSALMVVGGTITSFVVVLYLWWNDITGQSILLPGWFDFKLFGANLEFSIDRLAICMLLIITGIGSLIQVYSIGYMRDDPGFRRYFAYLGVFIFFMNILVTGANLPVVFIGWEGVGVVSYLLISFWFKNENYKRAGEKAFIVNRLGDMGFLLALACLVVLGQRGGLAGLEIWNFDALKQLFASSDFVSTNAFMATLALSGILFAVTAKSAQIPLFVWLPDAMAGPTPVSALIHAATMVTAGVYLIARLGFLCSALPEVMLVMALVGLVTAIMAGMIAMAQADIKKVLAYSTVSQLGFMIVAASCGLYGIAIFHVTTHAFFKACLFLCSGTVIHACDGEQDMKHYGGLYKHLPVTTLFFSLSGLALAGVFPLSGFYSKYLIGHSIAHSPLANALHGTTFFFGLESELIMQVLEIGLLVASGLTAFYITRVVLLTFCGVYRGEHEVHGGDGGFEMVLPVLILGIGAVIMGIPGAFIPEYLSEVTGHITGLVSLNNLNDFLLVDDIGGLIIKSSIALGGFGVALIIYYSCGALTLYSGSLPLLVFSPLARSRFFWDEFYAALIIKPFKSIARCLHSFVEPFVVDGIINGIWMSCVALGQMVICLQTGQVRTYALSLFSLFLALLVFYMVL
jgi:NADH-quinone oxidoreductase subunit L